MGDYMKIALAGNPNSGKTTLFNGLTGSNQYVGNWPGVTVEEKNGQLKGHDDVTVQDLPGIYSLSPYSPEEKVSRNFLVVERPDAILNIVDGSNLARNLYLTTQLAEVGVPMVVVVNMMDVVERNGDRIDFAKLGAALNCTVVGISAKNGTGTREAVEAALACAKDKRAKVAPQVFTGPVARAIAAIEKLIDGKVPALAIRWCAVKIFERDTDAVASLTVGADVTAKAEKIITDCEKALDDDAESLIAGQRYAFIQKVVSACVVKSAARGGKLKLSDRIDRIVTNRILAIPVFCLALLAMYWLAVADTGPGTRLTDWANDEFLGEGWFLPFSGERIRMPGVAQICGHLCSLVGIEDGTLVHALVNNGLVNGVCTVLGFIPVIAIVFLFLAFLEDCGYMARVAFIMDRLFRGFGLSGKSFIPMLVGKGCGVPAVMAARTIENVRDQRMTIILATFMPCGAKTVIITMFTACFFREYWWMAAAMDLMGVAIIVLGGIALKKTRLFADETAPFVMELPAYHLPTFKGVVIHTWERVKAYAWKAGMVIFPACVALTLLMTFDWKLNVVGEDALDQSILATVGGWIAWFFAPLGFGTWQGAMATISAEIAKEQATATLAMVAGGDGDATANVIQLFKSFGDESLYRVRALSFLLFNLFVPPCLVAIVATFREMGAAKWGWFAMAFQLFVGYVLALNAYQLGAWIVAGRFGVGTVAALLVDVFVLWMVVRPASRKGA